MVDDFAKKVEKSFKDSLVKMVTNTSSEALRLFNEKHVTKDGNPLLTAKDMASFHFKGADTGKNGLINLTIVIPKALFKGRKDKEYTFEVNKNYEVKLIGEK